MVFASRAVSRLTAFRLHGLQHRGGTTVLWNELRRHSEVDDFGEAFQSGVDYSEGTFLQNVYPRFGVGEEYSYLPSKLPGDLTCPVLSRRSFFLSRMHTASTQNGHRTKT